MLLLDTNVLSELMKSQIDPRVAAWIAMQTKEPLYTTVVSKAELLAGIAVMPTGRKRRLLESAFADVFRDFRGRVLSFDEPASAAYAEIFASRSAAGRPIKTMDLIIAAIARSRDATVVTRDIRGFEFTGVLFINPWDHT